MSEAVRSFIANIDWTAPLPWGAVTASVPASVIHEKGPAGEVATVIAILGWMFSPVLGLIGLTAGLAIAAWFSGKRRGADWRVPVLTAFPPAATLWLLCWADPDRWGAPSRLLAAPVAAIGLYLTLVLALDRLARRIEVRTDAPLDPKRHFTAKQRAQVIARWGNACVYCGADGDARGVRLEIDHIIPWSKGGRTCVSNAQPLCGPCNSLKADLPDNEARSRYLDLTGEPAGTYIRRRPRRLLLSRAR